jgi:hypothetical protein
MLAHDPRLATGMNPYAFPKEGFSAGIDQCPGWRVDPCAVSGILVQIQIPTTATETPYQPRILDLLDLMGPMCIAFVPFRNLSIS